MRLKITPKFYPFLTTLYFYQWSWKNEEKIVNLNFRAQKLMIYNIHNIDFLLDFEYSRQKLSKFSIIFNLIILFLFKITIFPRKLEKFSKIMPFSLKIKFRIFLKFELLSNFFKHYGPASTGSYVARAGARARTPPSWLDNDALGIGSAHVCVFANHWQVPPSLMFCCCHCCCSYIRPLLDKS